MADNDQQFLSRRKWLGLGLASTPVIAASLGAGLLSQKSSAAEPDNAASEKNLGARVYNVRDFGAKGDGKTLDTAAFQSAIDACTRDKGGTVLVPAGVFVIGTVEIKSNVTLHIAAQGIILGTADGKQYFAADAIPLHGDSTLEDGNVGLIFAVNTENVTIEGPGTIDGQGDQFRSPTRGAPSPAGITGPHRPYHLLFHQCKNLTVRDIFLKDSAFHSVRIIQSNYVWLTGIHIHSRRIHNSDGFHFISSQYVHINNCDIECQDDACALFGSCKFVTVTDCSFSTRWSVFRFGGGVAENITVSNCLIYETTGCPIKMRCSPGSRFENISFSNLVMKNVTGPISIGNGPRTRRPQPAAQPGVSPETQINAMLNVTPNATTNAMSNAATNATPDVELETPRLPGIVRNISFNGIHATVSKPVRLPEVTFGSEFNPGEIFSCITLNGFDEAVLENISFNDVHVTFPGGGTAEQAAVRDVPKVVGEYYAIGIPPAYALFARNVRGLTLQNVRFELAAPDLRPAVVFDHVSDAAVNGFSVQGNKEAESVLRFIDSQDVLLSATRVLTPASIFLQVEGAANKGITIDGGDLSKADKPLAFKNGANEKSVKLRA
ncbi:MAG TPA: glycosyl hydrolase family 28 protein [Verrucomicrobiae bacterium]